MFILRNRGKDNTVDNEKNGDKCMRAIVVDDEPIMTRRFERLSRTIQDLNLVGFFETPNEALRYVQNNPIEIAFLDIELPGMNGIQLAEELRKYRKDIMIVFVTAFERYIKDFNKIGGDYYIVKPYSQEVLKKMMEKLRLLEVRQHKPIYIQTFGRFLVKKKDKPIKLTGKTKEIFALLVAQCGKEISNKEIYATIWEGRPYSNNHMSVYYNALRRLKNILLSEEMGDLLLSTPKGQAVNIDLFDCDYYEWKEGKLNLRSRFVGEFLSEYSWGEYILGLMVDQE